MLELTIQQVRAFRLHMHHLNRYYKKSDLIDIVGTIGIQNSPPGAWNMRVSIVSHSLDNKVSNMPYMKKKHCFRHGVIGEYQWYFLQEKVMCFYHR